MGCALSRKNSSTAPTSGWTVVSHNSSAQLTPSGGWIGQPLHVATTLEEGQNALPHKHRQTKSIVLRRNTASIDYEYVIKVIMIGDSSTGKTSLLCRFTSNTFNDEETTTIGVDFKSRIIQLENRFLKLQIWDTAGQEQFRSVASSFFHGAAAIVLVFDITNRVSWNNVRNYWYQYCCEHRDSTDIDIILVGNKCDKAEARVVPTEEAQSWASDSGFLFLETSAKQNSMVEELFMNIAKGVLRNACLQ